MRMNDFVLGDIVRRCLGYFEFICPQKKLKGHIKII